MKLSEKLARMSPEAPALAKAPRRKSTGAWSTMKRRVRARVLEEIGPSVSSGRRAPAELWEEVTAVLDRVLAEENAHVTPKARQAFLDELTSDILGYGPLDPFLADPMVNEVMCNAADEIYVEREGVIERTDVQFTDEDQYRAVIDKIVAGVGRRLDESSPMVDARLPDGSRVNAIIPPLAIRAPVLTIRKFRAEPYASKDLINLGTMSMELALFLESCVRGKQNMVISGGTGSGKTTTLNVLSSFVPESERIVTIEDAAELRLRQPHVVSLEYRPPNVEGRGEVTIRDLVRNSLRMRPDRIVVGEVRGGEALDMLQAMNTGHEGSLTTIHANSPRDSLSRLETMVLMAGFDLPVRAIREQIASALELIIHQERLRDGSRRVMEVVEVQGMEGDTIILQTLFAHDHRTGKLRPTGLRPRLLERLRDRGVDLPAGWRPDARRTAR
ncbi:MAG: CpaF family protein [Actinomycetota bacterium]